MALFKKHNWNVSQQSYNLKELESLINTWDARIKKEDEGNVSVA